MADAAGRLDEVASAVADREAIDWERLQKNEREAPIRASTAALHLIERAAARAARPSGTAVALVAEVRPLPAWARLVLVVAVLQLLVGLAAPVAWSGAPHPMPPALSRLVGLVFGAAGLVLARAGRRDSRAVALGGFFLCIASALARNLLPLSSPVGWIASLAALLGGVVPDAFLAYFLWRFVFEFPRRLHFGPADLAARWGTRASAVLGMVLLVGNIPFAWDRASGVGREVFGLLSRRVGGFYWLGLSLLCLVAPVVAWVRSRRAPASERARFRWFLGGLTVGILPLFLAVLAESLVPPFARWVARPPVRLGSGIVLFVFLLSIPVTSAYAVLSQRVLELRVAVHRAAAFALARGTLLVLAALPTLGLLVHLNRHRNLPLGSVASGGATEAWLVATGIAWIFYAARKPLLRRLESWLVGSRRDVTPTLTTFAQEARQAPSVEEVAALVRDHVAVLVGATGATMLLRSAALSGREDGEAGEPARRHFVPVGGDRMPPLDDDSGIVQLARAASEPVSLAEDDRDSLYRWLVEPDREWVDHTGTALVAPLTGQTRGLAGLLALSRSRGGVPYRSAERQAVEAIAATTSLALERLLTHDAPVAPPARLAGECHRCGRVSPLAGGLCDCGDELAPAAIPFVLAGKFRLDRVLGRGGMGVVYRAVDLELGRAVALKTLPRLGADALERLRREARSMAGFVHPHLALIFGLESWQEVPVLVVEYLAGGSLAGRLPPGLPPRLALQVVAAVAGALDTMHRQGLLHRDVKPQNIAFTAEGAPKLLDFGLAHLAADAASHVVAEPQQRTFAAEERLTRSGAVAGTPLYLSPEVLQGQPPAPAQDLWSLHLVLWESLTGHHPLASVSPGEALARLIEADLPWGELAALGLPRTCVELLEAGLARDPAARPADAEAARRVFLAALEAC